MKASSCFPQLSEITFILDPKRKTKGERQLLRGGESIQFPFLEEMAATLLGQTSHHI